MDYHSGFIGTDAPDSPSESTGIRKGDLSEARPCCKEAVTEVLGRLKEQAVRFELANEEARLWTTAIPLGAIEAEEKLL